MSRQTFTVWGYPAGLGDEWAMSFGGPTDSKAEAVQVADSLFDDAELYGRRLRQVIVVDEQRRRTVHRRTRGPQ